MVRHRGTVLVDTNVILEDHRTGSWRALTGGYDVETVEDCVTETQTGFQRRQPRRLHRLTDLGLRAAVQASFAAASRRAVSEGRSYRRIARDLGISKNTVLDIVKRHRQAG